MTELAPTAELHAVERAFFAVLDAAVDIVISVALLGELVAVLANIFARAFLHLSLLWVDEVGGLALAVIAFIGGAIAYKRDHHAFVQTIVNKLPLPYRRICNALSDWIVLIVAALTAYLSLPYLVVRWLQTTPILGMPTTFLTLPLTVGMVLIVLYAAARLARSHRRTAAWTGVATAGGTTLAILTHAAWAHALTGDAPITLALVLFLVTVMIGLPVGFALIFSTFVYLYPSGAAPMIALPQNIGDGVGSFVLLALPFFILAGLVMERGGISARLIAFVRTLVGHVRGGLLQVMVVSMYIVSGLSGSKTADVAAVGMVMRDMLVREGYSLEEGAAVLAASAAMGETVPPSLGILVLGSITSISMGALFLGGLIPAAVVAVCLMILIYLRAGRSQAGAPARSTLREAGRAALGAVLPLLMPVILFAGILSGVATPTEVSSFAVAYGVLLAALAYRAIDARGFGRMIADSATVAGMILFILAAASAFSWALSAAQLPQRLVATIAGWNGNQALFMLASIVTLVILGSLLEGLPALLILAPLLLPLAAKLGISQLHYGIVLLIAMGIGAFLPPLGVGFYVACAVARTQIGPATKAMAPYAAVLMAGLLIVTFVPWFTLSLPYAFNLGR